MTAEARPFLLGCHLSIAKGFVAAIDEAERLGNSALQIFSRNAMQWRARPIDPDAAAAFRDRRGLSDVRVAVVHSSYLVNLASPDDALYERSIAATLDEVARSEKLGVEAVVLHLGAHVGSGREAGIARVAAAIDRVTGSAALARSAGLRLLLENTAGSGTTMGSSFFEIGEILGRLSDDSRVGVCLDTCHAFAAGYDLRDAKAVGATLAAFDREIGLGRLELIHLNDSKGPLRSFRDRHEHIGRGRIGDAGIAAVLRAPELRDLPVILETPKELAGRADADALNLARVRRLRGEGVGR